MALRYDWEGETSVIVHNLLGEASEFTLALDRSEGDQRDLVCLQTDERVAAEADDDYVLILQPYAYRWFRLGGLDELVRPHGSQH